MVWKKDRDEGRGAVASNAHCGLGRKGRRGVAERPQAGPRPWRPDVTPSSRWPHFWWRKEGACGPLSRWPYDRAGATHLGRCEDVWTAADQHGHDTCAPHLCPRRPLGRGSACAQPHFCSSLKPAPKCQKKRQPARPREACWSWERNNLHFTRVRKGGSVI